MPAELRPIREATGQVLAEDVVAPFDIPPRDNTAMDGYAVRAADTAAAGADVDGEGSAELRVIGELAAGYLYEGVVGLGRGRAHHDGRSHARRRGLDRPIRGDRRDGAARAGPSRASPTAPRGAACAC